jgi:hypothetical protein
MSPSGSSTIARVEKVITDFFNKLRVFSVSRPDLHVIVHPPMYRTSPIWYRDGLPDILQEFSRASMKDPRPGNLWILPSFPRPVLEGDGVHLTPFSGMEFVLHVFKASEEVVAKSKLPVAGKVSELQEESRALHDRVLVLEQGQQKIREKFDHQRAIDAELADFQENLRNEVFFMIRGLPRLKKMEPKEWQVQAKASVASVLSKIGFSGDEILFVQNVTGKGKDPKMHYKVRVKTSDVSRQIRDKFSAFFKDGVDSRPPELAEISIRNCVTPGTLARIAILQLLGKRYTTSNSKDSKFQVLGFEPRPLLKLTPPPGVADRRVQTYTYIDAISKLPTNFSTTEIADLLKRISPKLFGSLKEILVVITDDMVRRKGGRGAPSGSSHPGSGSESSPGAGPRGSSKRGASTPTGGPSAKK